MTTGGWITMIISVGSVVLLFLWCLNRVLFHKPPVHAEHLHGELDIKTKDRVD